MYVITVDVLNTIFAPYDTSGRKSVEKIVIFQKTTNMQALIQFSSVECALAARSALDGKNIYSNCCTLQINFSKLPEITVKENTERSRDYLNPALPTRSIGESLLTPGSSGIGHGLMGQPPSGPGGGAGGAGGERPVLIVSGFSPDHVGCDQLFNLFSNYGLIIRIKILHNKSNAALIQFDDGKQATQAMNFLRNVRMFGGTLDINFSRFSSITVSPSAASSGPTSDGKTVDYERSPLNRFSRSKPVNAQNLTAPTEVLHVSNINSSSITEDALKQHLENAAPVTQVKLFDHLGKQMGLVRFASVEAAVNAMCLMHNTLVGSQSIRLSFTRNRL
jgi:polypyrimidine tract-binding protein 2